ncbi:MAG TPA: two-component regulator propeller domain-containing protein [Flavobacteriales bacterium]
MRSSVLALTLFLSSASLAQEPLHRLVHFGVKEGLPHRVVNAIAQDERGLLWLATPAGVVRYDGSTFTTFHSAHGLLDDNATGLVMDGNGELWVSYSLRTASKDPIGIDLIDPATLQVRSFAQRFGDRAPCAAHEVVQVQADTEGALLLTTQHGEALRYDPRSGFRTLTSEDGTRCSRWSPIAGGYIGTVGDPLSPVALHHMDQQGRTLARHTVRGALRPVVGPAHDPSGRRYVLHTPHTTQLVRCSPDGRFLVESNMDGSSDWSTSIRVPLAPGVLLNGTQVRHFVDGRPAGIILDLASTCPELALGVNCFLQDEQGHTWIGTNFGLYQLDRRPVHFLKILDQAEIPKGFGYRIRGMGLHGPYLVANTDLEGSFTLDLRNAQLVAEDRSEVLRYALRMDTGDTFWSWEDPCLVRKRVSDQHVLQRIPLGEHGISVWSLLPLADGNMLVGSENGLRLVDPRTGNVTWPEGNDAASPLSRSRVEHLGTTPKGETWACTSTGLYRLENGRPVEHWCRSDSVRRLPVDHVLHFHCDEQGILWLATLGGGLVRLDRVRNDVRGFSTADGLPSSTVYAVHQDHAGMLWLPTDNGIVRFDPPTRQVTTYSTHDGIAHNEFNRTAHVQGADGRLYFGGLNGITHFHPDDLARTEHLQAQVVITGLRQFDAVTDSMLDRTADVLRTKRIVLLPDHRSFQLALALPEFTPGNGIHYAWRIEGLDKDWNEQRDPVLHFTQLPAGEHLLHIRARNANGAWTREDLQLTIEVQHGYGALPWLLGGGLLLLIVAAVLMRRSGRTPPSPPSMLPEAA